MGKKDKALEDLKKAIALNPKLKEKAKEDKDLKSLGDNDDIKKIVN
jgi:hypothetical protein